MGVPRLLALPLIAAFPLLTSCVLPTAEVIHAQASPDVAIPAGATIKDAYKGVFLIGTAGDVPGGFTEQELALIKGHFNAFTPENYLKPAAIHPAENIWSFERADEMVNWCRANNIVVHGHTLSWHAQTNPWFFEGGDKATVTKRLQDHITTLVGRYKGKIHSWDVVNEAINDGPNPETENLRPSPWVQNIGPEFLTIAFKAAHAADPNAVLYYNDYGIEAGAKHQSTMHLLRRLLREGAPVHGVGIQGHWSTSNLPYDQLDRAIANFGSLGLKVSISELDITISGSFGGQLTPGGPPGAGAPGAGAGGEGPATAPGARGRGRGAGGFGAGAGGAARGRGAGGGGGGPSQPALASTADSIRLNVADLTDDQRARLTAASQELATKLNQWQTASQEALTVVQPQYSAGQQAYLHEIAQYQAVQFQQNQKRDAIVNEAEIAMMRILTPAQAETWMKGRLREQVSARLGVVGATTDARAEAVIASHAQRILGARDSGSLTSARAAFWRELMGTLNDAQVTALLSPAQETSPGRGRNPGPVSAAGLNAQAQAYARVFSIFEKHKNVVERVTFWGLNDRRSWRSGENPLLFDIHNRPKPAYRAILEARRSAPTQP